MKNQKKYYKILQMLYIFNDFYNFYLDNNLFDTIKYTHIIRF